MKVNTKRTILSAAGLLLSASNAMAATSSNVSLVGNLQPLSDLGAQIISVSKWAAITVAILALLWIWVSGNYARLKTKVKDAMGHQDSVKAWIIEAVMVVFAFIVLYDFVIPFVIPYINSFIP